MKTGILIMIDIESVFSELNEPALFSASGVFTREGKNTLGFLVVNEGLRKGLLASLAINQSINGRYTRSNLHLWMKRLSNLVICTTNGLNIRAGPKEGSFLTVI